ncbi:MAG: homoserine O-acetyltransferase [Phycisphaera sp.]|nr:homoserine O-acetyltransferase [Phycisphaera sp.]
MTLAFDSTDSIRSAQPLRHAQSVTFDKPLKLSHGSELPGVTVAYETWGTLNPAKDNAVLVCHAISGDSHCARHDEQDDPGWWDELIGPGKSIDTDRYFVVCSNVLGGCRGTTGPISTDPRTGKPFGGSFPLVTVTDMVSAQVRLADHLGIERWAACVGGSLGGHQAMTWATRYPGRVARCFAIATSPRLSSQALAFDVVGRNAILRDPDFHGGQYYDKPTGPTVGLALARMLGHITYLSPEAMSTKFDLDRNQPHEIATDFEKRFSVGSYLAHQGDKFVERFDANSYVTISLAMDLFDLGATPRELRTLLGKSACDWLIVSFSSDWLFTPKQSCEMAHALLREGRSVTYVEIPSDSGHDAFLLRNEIGRYGRLLRAKLDGPSRNPSENVADHNAHSLFNSSGIEYEQIMQFIPKGSGVLDLGCGTCGLLAKLRERDGQDVRLMGVDVNEEKILLAVEAGFDVIDHDLNTPLSMFEDGAFDVVVLSQTLQAVNDVQALLDEMVRVGQRAVVSFPNFAHRSLREMFFHQGRIPKSPGAYGFDWHNSPNRRFPTILDFEDFCRDKGYRIETAVALDLQNGTRVTEEPNLHADTAIYVLRRASGPSR